MRTFQWADQRVSALLALLGLIGSIGGLRRLPDLVSGAGVERPLAVAAQCLMALICFGFLVPLIARMSMADHPLRRGQGQRSR